MLSLDGRLPQRYIVADRSECDGSLMTGRASIANPRAKLARAAEHFGALQDEYRAFVGREPHSVEWGSDPAQGWTQAVFRVTEEPPLRLGLIFGDAIHNLRAALDNLICELARLGGNNECRTTQFPICTSESEFERRRPTWLAGVDDAHVGRIRTYQPFAKQNEAALRSLIEINRFDNLDKHRAIQPCVVAPSTDPRHSTVRREPRDTSVTMEFHWVTTDRPLYDGAVIARFRAGDTRKSSQS